MPSLQCLIDTICARITVDCVYQMIQAMLEQGAVALDEILPLIQSKDRSLDLGSARMIARCAVDDMLQQGKIRVEGETIYRAS